MDTYFSPSQVIIMLCFNVITYYCIALGLTLQHRLPGRVHMHSHSKSLICFKIPGMIKLIYIHVSKNEQKVYIIASIPKPQIKRRQLLSQKSK